LHAARSQTIDDIIVTMLYRQIVPSSLNVKLLLILGVSVSYAAKKRLNALLSAICRVENVIP